MVVNKRSSHGDQRKLMDLYDQRFDTIALIYKEIKYKSINKDIGSYDCVFKTGTYKEMHLFYNKNTHMPVKVIYTYKKPIKKSSSEKKFHTATLEIDYENFTETPIIKADTFSEKRFFQLIDKKKLKPLAIYSSYQIINNL
jgi:hypothetical protein